MEVQTRGKYIATLHMILVSLTIRSYTFLYYALLYKRIYFQENILMFCNDQTTNVTFLGEK